MQKFNEVSLNRTFCPKTVIYRSDGFGRDYYISKNCGGFSIQEGSPIGQKQMLVYNTKCSNSPGKFLVYRANGTGRDSYISCNSGGFRAEHDKGYTTFHDNLRNHMPILSRSHRKSEKIGRVVIKKIDWYSPKIKKCLRKTRYLQDRHSKELSTPKVREMASQFLSGSHRFASTIRSKNVSKEFDLKQSSVDLPIQNPRRQSRMQEILSHNNFNHTNL